MIIVITVLDEEDPRPYASHGVDHKTLQITPLPYVPASTIAKWDADLQEWVLFDWCEKKNRR